MTVYEDVTYVPGSSDDKHRMDAYLAEAELQVLAGYTHEDMVLAANGDDDRITPAIAVFVAAAEP